MKIFHFQIIQINAETLSHVPTYDVPKTVFVIVVWRMKENERKKDIKKRKQKPSNDELKEIAKEFQFNFYCSTGRSQNRFCI